MIPVKRTNTLVTIFGGLAVLGQIPELVTRAGINMPLVWNSITPWLSLCGIVFGALAFWAARGADQSSTQAQVDAATKEKEAQAAVAQANATTVAPTQIEIVHSIAVPEDDPALATKATAAAELAKLRAELAAKQR